MAAQITDRFGARLIIKPVFIYISPPQTMKKIEREARKQASKIWKRDPDCIQILKPIIPVYQYDGFVVLTTDGSTENLRYRKQIR